MRVLICSATAKELAALAPAILPEPETITEMEPRYIKLGQHEALFLATGVGPINAALAIGRCIGMASAANAGHSPFDALIYAGLAGAFDLGITPLCSLWSIDEEIWPEYGLNDGIGVTARAFSFPLWTRPDGENIHDRIWLANPEELKIFGRFEPFPHCTSLTVAGVTASFARRERLWNLYRAPLENMEGFAAAYAAARARIPCVEIRAVSNKTGPRSRDEKNFEGALLTLGKILPALNLTG